MPIADPIIGLAITLVILKITWDSWHTVRNAKIDLSNASKTTTTTDGCRCWSRRGLANGAAPSAH